MGTGITGTPNEYDFGLDFNYELWTQETAITLCNVRWNSDYRDVVKFDSKAALNAYVNSSATSPVTIANASYAKANVPVRLNIPFNRANRYNYLRASNPIQPVPGSDIQKDYYYFILDVRYIAPNTTEFVIQIDVWATYILDITFGNCYVERGHIGIANTRQMENYGRDYLGIPEGLDTGGEYRIINKRKQKVAGVDVGDERYDALIVSTIDIRSGEFGTEDDPKLKTARGGSVSNLGTGASFYVIPGSPTGDQQSLIGFMLAIQDYPWISQGIISITLIPPVTRYYTGFTYNDVDPATNPLGITNFPGAATYPKKYTLYDDWRNSSGILNAIPSRYRALKKFLTFPYMAIELTTWYGAPIIAKPESWADDNATILERATFMPPGQRITFHPRFYNGSASHVEDHLYPAAKAAGLPNYDGFDGDDQGEYLDFFTQISAFPTVPIVNNNASMYLAQNAHGLAFQNDSAQWSQQRALAGNQTSYDNTSTGMRLANELTGIGRTQDAAATALGNNLMGAQAALDALSGIGMGAGMGALGGPAGAAIGGIGGAANALVNGARVGMNQQNNVQQNAVRSNAALGSNAASQRASGEIRDSNKGLADWASKGDYQNQIAGINARVQDSRLAQPSTSGQFGGEASVWANNNVELNARWKLIDPSAVKRIGEFWLRYGYAIQEFMALPASLQVMSKFTYWKLQETYIIDGDMPEPFKQTIRGILEKGVTVWKNPADIGNVDMASNVPLAGVSY